MLAAALLVPAAVGSTAPRVRLLDASPAVVSGAGFHPRERVVVTVRAGTTRLSKAVETSARGAFVARFARTLHVPACGQLAVAARGALGDHAAWKSPLPDCGTSLQPTDR